MLVTMKNIKMYCDIVKNCNNQDIASCEPITVTEDKIIVNITGRIGSTHRNNLDNLKYRLQAVLLDFDKTREREVEVTVTYEK